MNRLHRRNRRRQIFWTIVKVAIVCAVLYILIMEPVRYMDLTGNRVITTGVVTGTYSRRGGVNYVFYVNSNEYKGSTGYADLTVGFCESLTGRNFPVIYSSKHIRNSQMLLTKATFKWYDMEQPDSLKWIEKYVRKW